MIKITVENSETKTKETFFGDTVLLLANRKYHGLMCGRVFLNGTYPDLTRAYLDLGTMILKNINQDIEKTTPELAKRVTDEYIADEERLQATVKGEMNNGTK